MDRCDLEGKWDFGGPNGDCYEWLGQLSGPVGYKQPITLIDGKMRTIARFVYSIEHPDEDLTGKIIQLTCGNRCCINAAHMVSRTRKGMHRKEASKKNRVQGSKVCTAKLDEDKVRVIRSLCASGANQSELARQYDVTPGTINQIATNRTWKHVI